jgi:transglutaminase-like putative cysteine protease
MKIFSIISCYAGLLGMLASCAVNPSTVARPPARPATAPTVTSAASAVSATFHVRHSLEVTDIPKTAETVQIWFWLPDDDASQKLLDVTVQEAPKGYQITRDATYGHRYLHAEVSHPNAAITMDTDFVIRRSAVSIALDPARAGQLNELHRQEFARELRLDVPNMEVTADIAALAQNICGQEQNVVRKTRLLFDWVVDNTNHYSRPNAPKSSGKGSTAYCLTEKGGSCTDMHSLFISLARAQGIPTRLQFGTLLKPINEGKALDPGYRCWVEYFVPNYGWIPADLAAANTNPAKRDFYFSGLDERRIHFVEGRDLELSPKQAGPRLNLLISAYVEVDGKPHASFKRVLKFEEVKPNNAPSNKMAAISQK